MPTCHICKKEEIQYRCPDCGRLVCKDCICEGLCMECYKDVPFIPKAPANKTSNTKPKHTVSCGAIALGVLFPLIAIPAGLIIIGVSQDEEKKEFGRDSIRWSIVGLIITAILFTICET